MRSSLSGSDLEALRAENQSLLRLLELSRELAFSPTLGDLARAALGGAIELSGASSGELQLLDFRTGTLQLVAQHGFRPSPLDQLEWARQASDRASAQALQGRERVSVPDVLQSPLVRESPEGLALIAAGVRAFQVAPLVSRQGDPLGVLTCCWDSAHEPAPSTLRVLDQLALQTGELIQQRRTAEALAQTQAALHEASLRTDAFVAMLGYELREPLAPILTSLQIMEMRGSAHARDERQVIGRQVQHLVRLVDDLQEASRIALGRIELSCGPQELRGVLTEARDRAAPALAQRSQYVFFAVEPELVVHADRGRLVQVFANVLLNVAKYAEAGCSIWVRAERMAEQIWVSIRDDGAGARPDLRGSAASSSGADGGWRSFEHPAALERAPEKGGLTLTIVQSLVALHGGRVQLRGGPKEGNEIVVWLPASDVRPRVHGPVAESPRQCRKPGSRRVLIVEDNPDAAQSLANALRLLGYSVEIAPDGPSALAKFSGFAPEIALVDIGLPVMGGYELARRIRARHSAVRLLAVTGFGQARDLRRSAEVGFEAHLIKPIDIDALEGAIGGSQLRWD